MNKEEEEKLKDLVIYSMKELGEIAEVLVKKDRPEHWKNELGDLCALGIKPMLELAGMNFEYAIELGLVRQLHKLRGKKELKV